LQFCDAGREDATGSAFCSWETITAFCDPVPSSAFLDYVADRNRLSEIPSHSRDMTIWIPNNAHERLSELAAILAAGLLRLSTQRSGACPEEIAAERIRHGVGSSPMPKRKSSQITDNTRVFSLDIAVHQSSHPRPSVEENLDV
jgi:hypothetical protein